MQCPLDQTELRPVDRQGVEIDYCPQCRGVWLDRGELDKLIDRTVEAFGRVPDDVAPAGTRRAPAARDDWDDRGRPDDRSPLDRLYGERDRERYRDDQRRDWGSRRDDDDHRGASHEYGRRRRRKSWFEDIFDFD